MNQTRAVQIAADLAGVVKGDVFSDSLRRIAFASDASIYQIEPDCVVAPKDKFDIAAVVKYAAERGIPVAARGAGSGVAGESLCSGIVIDVTRYMNNILDTADDGSTVVCEPGVVLSDLNNHLAQYGRKIGPDPSTANRAVMGGCVANNATGAHSLEYGYMGDYVESIEAVLADGGIVELTNGMLADQCDEKLSEIIKRCQGLLVDKAEVIQKALPTTKRNRSGYMIAGICHDGKVDLARLMGGSEGTLAVFTKLTLRTVPLPKMKGLAQFEFDSFEKMAKAVPIIVESGASACELMDEGLIGIAAEHLPKYRDILPVDAKAALLVEHIGENEQQIKDKIAATEKLVSSLSYGKIVVLDDDGQKRLWRLRKDAVPLLSSAKSRKRPIPFIEDVSVENTKLAEYIAGLEKVSGKYGIRMAYYGHAGDGELHIRPYLDLSEPDDIQKMIDIANDVFTLAWSLGGSISGEHGDGLVRAAFIRKQYGDEFYDLLCKIKKIFDPAGVLNPGKIINDDENIMTKNLRFADRVLKERSLCSTGMLFEDDELELELEQCNGCGVCRGTEKELRMCPVFRAIGDEPEACRAKINVVKAWAKGHIDDKELENPEFRKFLDLCVNCKMCTLDCPSGVDVSKVMAAARAEYVRRKGLRKTEFVLGHNRYLSWAGNLFSPISNFVMSLGITKWALQFVTGIDKRRSMPRFAWGSFIKAGRKYLQSKGSVADPIDKVAYFVDTFANYNDHELGYAVLDVLRANNIEVIIPDQRPTPLPAIVYGDVKTARKDLAYSVKHLAKAVRDGYKIICSEPSAALCLKQEMRHYVAGDDVKLVSENTYELMDYLYSLAQQGKLTTPAKKISGKFGYHTPCHLFAIAGYGACFELLQACGAEVIDLKAGCCGLSGTYGMQKKNYELADATAKSLKDAIDKSDANYILTECAACAMQIEHISQKSARHPIKLLAQAYGK